jgi:signal transduction histidine kinase
MTAGSLVISITDSVAGISEANQKHIFHEIIQIEPEKLQAGGGSGFVK